MINIELPYLIVREETQDRDRIGANLYKIKINP